ncbi:hypothetical protein [Saccharomonospora saliphila]|uniref:hypothetical protein n=1 Tax=Saccharomonospora saliphila TaxID=369829 RepID=UPI000491D959|nr:hypothetical protein [Saccharomonospora saliphila]
MPWTGPDDPRSARVQDKLAVPVLSAALVSVPAVFLATTPGVTGLIGSVLNWLSLSVLLGESFVLLWVSGSVRTWVYRYRAQLLVVALTIPAVVFVVGPVQILRLVLTLGAFRILRVRRIMRAGWVIVHKAGLHDRRGHWVLAGVGVLATVFALVVLSDPASRSRKVLDHLVAHLGAPGTALAALGVLCAGLVVANLLHHDRW